MFVRQHVASLSAKPFAVSGSGVERGHRIAFVPVIFGINMPRKVG